MNSNSQAVEDLRWKKFPVLSDGFVTLVDVMGDDQSVVQAARVSYGKDKRDYIKEYELDPGCMSREDFIAEKKKRRDAAQSDDQNLLRYLMRHRHSTPFEMAEVKLLVRVPMDCWRQWIRHRTANVNEYSTRYTEAIDSMDKTPVDQWRLQAENNKQGSSGLLEEWPKSIKPNGESLISVGGYLSAKEGEFHERAKNLYQERLKFGIAREQARKDLPLSTYTESYWKCDLHNILGFLALRMDSHAQQEIRQYATIIGEQIIKPLFPMVWEAFEDYRLGAMTLTRLEISVISMMLSKTDDDDAVLPWREGFSDLNNPEIWPEEWRDKAKCRERDECIAKLKRLGLVTE